MNLPRGQLDAGLGQGEGGTVERSYLNSEEFAAVCVPIE